MISKIFTITLLFTLAFLLSACTKIESAKLKEVTLEDRNSSGEVVITYDDFQPTQVSTSSGTKSEPVRTLADKSELSTMFDGYGNKTETRRFIGHSRLDMVIVRTSTDNVKQVFVYGFGDIVSMDGEFASTALSASADEIANAAGLKTTRPFKSSFTTVTPTPVPLRTPTQIRPAVQSTPDVQTNESLKTDVQTQETDASSSETQNRQLNQEK